jgi:hypothetical protein
VCGCRSRPACFVGQLGETLPHGRANDSSKVKRNPVQVTLSNLASGTREMATNLSPSRDQFGHFDALERGTNGFLSRHHKSPFPVSRPAPNGLTIFCAFGRILRWRRIRRGGVTWHIPSGRPARSYRLRRESGTAMECGNRHAAEWADAAPKHGFLGAQFSQDGHPAKTSRLTIQEISENRLANPPPSTPVPLA